MCETENNQIFRLIFAISKTRCQFLIFFTAHFYSSLENFFKTVPVIYTKYIP